MARQYDAVKMTKQEQLEQAVDYLFAAVQVVRLTPSIKQFLEENDPMALKQLNMAIEIAESVEA